MNKIFHFNYYHYLVPGIFLSAGALIWIEIPELKWLYMVLFVISITSTIAVTSSITTIIITDNQLGIRKIWKSRVIDLGEILQKKKRTNFRKGVESNTWSLTLDDGEEIVILSDPMRDAKRLKEALNWFLRDIPTKGQEIR